jgi:antitoxin HicB
VRSNLTGNRIARVFMVFTGERVVALHGFVTKTQRTPPADLALALKKPMIKKPKSAIGLSTLDEHLAAEGKLEEFQAVAIKEVLAWQIEQAMKAQKLSRKRLADRMGTSRSQVARLLDPKDGNVTLTTLQRAAAIVGRKVRLELV